MAKRGRKGSRRRSHRSHSRAAAPRRSRKKHGIPPWAKHLGGLAVGAVVGELAAPLLPEALSAAGVGMALGAFAVGAPVLGLVAGGATQISHSVQSTATFDSAQSAVELAAAKVKQDRGSSKPARRGPGIRGTSMPKLPSGGDVVQGIEETEAVVDEGVQVGQALAKVAAELA